MSRQLGFGLPESHLLPDAVVAFVDNEMSPAATERAAEHVAHCPWCAADVDAQRQVRAAVQDACEPSMSAGFLASLQSIPQDTDVEATPDNLAVTEDGQLVAVQRPGKIAGLRGRAVGGVTPLGGSEPLGRSALGRSALGQSAARQSMARWMSLGRTAPLGRSGTAAGADGGAETSTGGSDGAQDTGGAADGTDGGAGDGQGKRRAAQGAGVVVSGLVLSALALVGTTAVPIGDQNRIQNGGEAPNTNVLRAQLGNSANAPGAAVTAPTSAPQRGASSDRAVPSPSSAGADATSTAPTVPVATTATSTAPSPQH